MLRALDLFDAKIKNGTLANPTYHPELLERQISLSQAEFAPLDGEGRVQIRLIYQLLRRGYKWPDVAARFAEADRQ